MLEKRRTICHFIFVAVWGRLATLDELWACVILCVCPVVNQLPVQSRACLWVLWAGIGSRTLRAWNGWSCIQGWWTERYWKGTTHISSYNYKLPGLRKRRRRNCILELDQVVFMVIQDRNPSFYPPPLYGRRMTTTDIHRLDNNDCNVKKCIFSLYSLLEPKGAYIFWQIFF